MSLDINYNLTNTDPLLLPSPPTNKQTNVGITLIDKHLFIGKKWGVEVAVAQSNSASGRNKEKDYKHPLAGQQKLVWGSETSHYSIKADILQALLSEHWRTSIRPGHQSSPGSVPGPGPRPSDPRDPLGKSASKSRGPQTADIRSPFENGVFHMERALYENKGKKKDLSKSLRGCALSQKVGSFYSGHS